MIRPLCPDRVRKISGTFAFIEHRFVQDGFWSDLDQHSLLLFLFLVLVADRHGLSYYSYDKICTLLRLTLDDYILARNSLMDKDLIAFDGRLFQVLSLPVEPKRTNRALLGCREQLEREDPATVHQLIEKSFRRNSAI
jgi:hypothetical protein